MSPEIDAVRSVLDTLAHDIYVTANLKGFYDEERSFGEAIALMHSELSEALEAYRVGDPMSEKIANHTQIEEEFADTIIRILDTSEHLGLDIGGALVAKMRYNEGRPHRHGGKKL